MISSDFLALCNLLLSFTNPMPFLFFFLSLFFFTFLAWTLLYEFFKIFFVVHGPQNGVIEYLLIPMMILVFPLVIYYYYFISGVQIKIQSLAEDPLPISFMGQIKKSEIGYTFALNGLLRVREHFQCDSDQNG